MRAIPPRVVHLRRTPCLRGAGAWCRRVALVEAIANDQESGDWDWDYNIDPQA